MPVAIAAPGLPRELPLGRPRPLHPGVPHTAAPAGSALPCTTCGAALAAAPSRRLPLHTPVSHLPSSLAHSWHLGGAASDTSVSTSLAPSGVSPALRPGAALLGTWAGQLHLTPRLHLLGTLRCLTCPAPWCCTPWHTGGAAALDTLVFTCLVHWCRAGPAPWCALAPGRGQRRLTPRCPLLWPPLAGSTLEAEGGGNFTGHAGVPPLDAGTLSASSPCALRGTSTFTSSCGCTWCPSGGKCCQKP